MNPTTENLARIDAWLETLARETDQARHAEAFTGYLDAMARFWRYSDRNSLLILEQRPQARHVNSRKRWAELGYTLKRDEWKHSIAILCPHFKKLRDEATGEERQLLTHFTTGYIFDETQVEATPDAQPLQAPWVELSGDYTATAALLHAVCTNLHIGVTVEDLEPSTKGYSTGTGQIVIARGQSPGNACQTLIHEIGHEVNHPSPLRPQFSTQEVECQAEAIAYCVSVALDMPAPNSGTYLALYQVTPDVLRANATAIHQGVRRILGEIDRLTSSARDVAA